MASKIEAEVEVRSDAGKFWESIKESTTLFPKAFPDQYQSIHLLQGDGKSAGSVRLINYAPAVTALYIDGDVLNYYKNFKAYLTVTPKGENKSTVKWACEFDKANEDVPNPDIMRDFAVKCTFQ
ncbi:hypothetical protein ACJIZ3_010279 [Penstemon smallii]|uniref:Bet v I/Major latex protein domain-containing protein n=1 Tax=Penstemon smallii TaxID=265156 RepID=A0ABD3TGS3_9LAMI